MKNRSFRRAATGASTLCLASVLLSSCDQPAPGLAKASSISAPSVFSEVSAPIAPVRPAPAVAAPVPGIPAPAPAPAVVPAPVVATPAPAPTAPAPVPVVAAPAPAAAPAPTASAIKGPTMSIKPVMPIPLFAGTPLPLENPPPNLDTSMVPVLDALVPDGVTLFSMGKPVT